jgi:hypothetical protein
MTVLGACGVLSTGAILLAVGSLPRHHLQHGWGAMLVVVFTMLLVRSSLHVRAGVSGLRASSFDRPSELVTRYASFGVLSACCVGGVLALFAMAERLAPQAIVSVGVTGWLLGSWPAIVKRYFNQQQFAELLAGDRVVHRRAPDAGLTSLGWLLTGHAVLVAALLTIAATAQPDGPGRALVGVLRITGPVVGHTVGELVLAAGVVVLELGAAVALIRMSVHRRALATIYALVGGAVGVALVWSLMQTFDHHGGLLIVLRFTPAAFQIVLPTATLLLVHRAVVPIARARYRGRAGAAARGAAG